MGCVVGSRYGRGRVYTPFAGGDWRYSGAPCAEERLTAVHFAFRADVKKLSRTTRSKRVRRFLEELPVVTKSVGYACKVGWRVRARSFLIATAILRFSLKSAAGRRCRNLVSPPHISYPGVCPPIDLPVPGIYLLLTQNKHNYKSDGARDGASDGASDRATARATRAAQARQHATERGSRSSERRVDRKSDGASDGASDGRPNGSTGPTARTPER